MKFILASNASPEILAELYDTLEMYFNKYEYVQMLTKMTQILLVIADDDYDILLYNLANDTNHKTKVLLGMSFIDKINQKYILIRTQLNFAFKHATADLLYETDKLIHKKNNKFVSKFKIQDYL
jgi:hypothetical protein